MLLKTWSRHATDVQKVAQLASRWQQVAAYQLKLSNSENPALQQQFIKHLGYFICDETGETAFPSHLLSLLGLILFGKVGSLQNVSHDC